jgi:hypothetical protein
MAEIIRIKKSHIFGIVVLSLLFVWFCVYGYFLIKEDQQENCWDKYQTEQEAILNCEGVNE